MLSGSQLLFAIFEPSGDMSANIITVNASNNSNQGNITLNGTLTASNTISVTNSEPHLNHLVQER